MIGDPSGRSSERNLLDLDTLDPQRRGDPRPAGALPRLLAGPDPGARWPTTSTGSGKLSLIDFLRDTGKHFTIPYMLAKDSVQQRLERGLSFTEFSYMTLQALDFAHALPRARRRDADGRRGPVGQHHGRASSSSGGPRATRTESPAHGIAYKLLLSPSGASSARARAASRCGSTRRARRPTRSTSTGSTRTTATSGRTCAGSPCSRATRSRRWTPRSSARPEQREAQRRLAFDVTARVHGEAAAREAVREVGARSSGARSVDRAMISWRCGPGAALRSCRERRSATPLTFAVGSSAYSSNGEARRGMQGGGFYVNDDARDRP